MDKMGFGCLAGILMRREKKTRMIDSCTETYETK